ncbi:MAG: transposase [Elusimicrobiota bacterium]|jgi:transposase-like protein|nr:transposase [Elusimicrobiota bacterium]
MCHTKIKKITQDLKVINTATDQEAAKDELEKFKIKWDGKYPTIYEIWRQKCEGIVPF